MTNEEAIEILKQFKKCLSDVVFDEKGSEAWQMAIQALSQEPCERFEWGIDGNVYKITKAKDGKEICQQVCDDAISRQAVLDVVFESRKNFNNEFDQGFFADKIRDLPPVTPQQKSGKWIPVSERLPEAFSFVNCTCHSLIDDREDWVVETCYLPQLPDSPYSDWGNIPMLNMGDCEVVAWMYRDIPKPYKVDPQESESDA